MTTCHTCQHCGGITPHTTTCQWVPPTGAPPWTDRLWSVPLTDADLAAVARFGCPAWQSARPTPAETPP